MPWAPQKKTKTVFVLDSACQEDLRNIARVARRRRMARDDARVWRARLEALAAPLNRHKCVDFLGIISNDGCFQCIPEVVLQAMGTEGH